jgi:hypothetical protein
LRRSYLIHVPSGDRDITYGIASQPPMYAVAHGQTYDYPVILVTRGTFFNADITITLSLHASAPSSFITYYHRSRTHLGLQKDTPESRPAQLPEAGPIISIPEVGGLHHRYERRAA